LGGAAVHRCDSSTKLSGGFSRCGAPEKWSEL